MKILSTLALLLTVAVAQAQTVVDGLTYSFSTETSTATLLPSAGAPYEGSITLPATVEHEGQHFQLQALADNAFNLCEALTQVTVPEGVITIGKSAFKGCTHLRSVTLPSTLTTIDNNAFQNCKQIVAIHLPDGLTKLGNDAFSNCTLLGEIDLGNALTTLGFRTFQDCANLSKVVLPSTLTTIENLAFSGCGSLQQIVLPASLTKINYKAFDKCYDLKTVQLLGTTPPAVNRSFPSSDDLVDGGLTIIVPDEAKADYLAHEVWGSMKAVTTGVNKVKQQKGWQITANGQLLWQESGATYRLCHLSGATVQSGVSQAGQSLSLPRGIYLLQVNGLSHKIIIK